MKKEKLRGDPTRRGFFGSGLTAGALGVANSNASQQSRPTPARRPSRLPNIVLVMADQFRHDALGLANPAVKTPNIDRLARSGVRFTHCFTPQPLCTPARASMLTSYYPHVHGLDKNVYPDIAPDWRSRVHLTANPFTESEFKLTWAFPFLLQQAGYQTACFGKWHLGTVNPGFFDMWRGYNSWLGPWVGKQDASDYRSDLETDSAIKFMNENASKPFFTFMGYYPPHDPYLAPRRFASMYDGMTGDQAAYYACVSNIDWNVGRLMRTLEELRLVDDTLVIFTSDHGETFQSEADGPRPGSLHKAVCNEDSIRVPLILRYPRQLPSGRTLTSGASLLDIYPTLLDLTGIEAPPPRRAVSLHPLQGRSLYQRMLNHASDKWEDPIIVQTWTLPAKAFGDSPSIQRCIRTSDWKLIVKELPERPEIRADELYHLTADPGEMNNLIRNAESGLKRQELGASLAEWGNRWNDRYSVKLGQRYL